MTKREEQRAIPDTTSVPAMFQRFDDAVDAALKRVLGDNYDPNWRDWPPERSPFNPDYECGELRRPESIPFLNTPYRIRKSVKPTRHRLGGRKRAITPKCRNCRAPLVLFADFDATDSQLRGKHSLRRLPLYYCCSCPGPVYYRVLPSGDVKVVGAKFETYDDCPFQNWPPAIPSGHLQLQEIPVNVNAAISAARKDDGSASLNAADLRAIAKVLGRMPRGRLDLDFSQIGGVPDSFQGDEGKPNFCPNVTCPNRRRRRQEFKYRPLAVLAIWDDRFWGPRKAMLDVLQIVFHICPGCFCISAKYTCT